MIQIKMSLINVLICTWSLVVSPLYYLYVKKVTYTPTFYVSVINCKHEENR